MKTITRIQPLAWIVLILVGFFWSCQQDEDKAPEIYRVRTTDPALKDSSFVQANPGQMIVIEGNNLETTREIYINNQNVLFNTNYVTHTSIIMTIPSDLELTATNPDLPKEIRVVTDYGTAVYAFHVLASAPAITFMEVGKYPIETGDRLVLIGENFFEIEKLVIEGENGTDVEVADFEMVVAPTEENSRSELAFSLPAGVEESGEVVLYCAAGEAAYPYSLNIMPPTVTSYSSDMPIVGDEFYITGSNFIGVERVLINGEVEVSAENLKVSATQDTIYLSLPQAPSKSGYIAVTTVGGTTESTELFYPLEYVIANFDDKGSRHWYGSELAADGSGAPYITTGEALRGRQENVGAYNWWMGDGNVDYTVVLSDLIADNTPMSDLVLRYECYLAYPLSGVTFGVALPSQGKNFMEDYVPVSVSSGRTEIGKWMTCEIALSTVNYTDDSGNAATIQTYGDLKKLKAKGDDYLAPGFFPVNKTEIAAETFEAWFDNIRILKKK